MAMNNDEMKMIRHMLTLRYNPYKVVEGIRKRTWKDFVEYHGIESAVVPAIEGELETTLDPWKYRKIGISMSGGVDSTTVLALTKNKFPDLRIIGSCITFGDEDREFEDAQNVAETFGIELRHVHIKQPLLDLPKHIAIVKEPRWNTYAYYFFDSLKDCDMIMTGDGGDENFGGYAFRYDDVTKMGLMGSFTPKDYLSTQKMDWIPDQVQMFNKDFGFTWSEIYDSICDNFSNSLNKLGQTFLADWNGKLVYDFFPTNNAFVNHFKIVSFSPLLSDNVTQIATHLPYFLKYDPRNKIGKIYLRELLLRNFGYRATIKPKVGFGQSRDKMWEWNKELIISKLDKPLCVEFGIIDKNWLQTTLPKIDTMEPLNKMRYISKMLMLYSLEIYLCVIDKSSTL